MNDTTKKRKHRVLLIAEQANPEWVSVPLEGWCHSQAIAQRTDAHIVTQVRNRDAFTRAGLVEGQDFTALDSERIAAPVYKAAGALRGGAGKGWTTIQAITSVSYYYFEHLLWQQFGKRIKSGEFDLVHRLTPLSPTVPSLIVARGCRAAGVPFVWGPINGGVPWPKGFDHVRRQEKEWLSYIRGAYRLLPGYRTTRVAASAIIVGSSDTFAQLGTRYQKRAFYVPENAISPERFVARRSHQAQKPVRAIFVGRLVPYKGADLVLKAAAALIRRGELHVQIIGDGPQMPVLKELVAKEQLQAGVELAGWVKHEEVQEHLVKADVFAFPSIREFGGAVALEAMAVGLVPIVVNYGGPKELVTEKSGFRIPMGSRTKITTRLREIFEDLVKHPEQIEPMSQAALKRAHTLFTWDAKAEQVTRLYDWLLEERSQAAARPDFPMPLPELD